MFTLFRPPPWGEGAGESEHHGEHPQRSSQIGLWGGRSGRLSREAPLHGEVPAWGLGGSWHLATLQLPGRGGWGVGVGVWAERFSWCCFCL